MLHAAAILFGLIVLWMLSTQAWGSPQEWAIAAGVSVACVLVVLRFGGASTAYLRAPHLLWLRLSRIGAAVRGALATIRRALSADVTLDPALVRVKLRAPRSKDRASFAHALSATPGMTVVETDADGLLLHVIDEHNIDAAELGRLEQALVGGNGGAT
jgi:multisubunit Na+/H+ antiporter MnhE subunit